MHFCSRPVSPSIVHFLVVVVVFGGCCHFCLIDVDGFVGCSPFSTLFIYLCAFYLFTHLHTAKYKRFAVAASVVTVVNTAAIAAATAAAYETRAYRCVFFGRCDTNVNEIDTKWSIAVLLLIRHLMTHTDSAYENILPVTLFHFPEMVSLKCFHFIDAFSFFCLFFFFLFIFVEVTCSKNVVTM